MTDRVFYGLSFLFSVEPTRYSIVAVIDKKPIYGV